LPLGFESLMKLYFSGHMFRKLLKYQFHENPSSGAELFHADGQTEKETDTTSLTVAFRNFSKSPKMDLKGMGCTFVDWLVLAQDTDKWRTPLRRLMDICAL
jgi:hypothetical protein